ncbi:MAG: HDOD domain-containing protein [Pseudomonadales bacterium]|nr:HDOD domain-containing protein [Pseudomonadales bacterium]
MSKLARMKQVELIFEDKLERRELELPILPKVAAMVIELTMDENSDAQQLSRLIQGDQALAGHVMRIANSPIYRPVSAFVSLQQAIARLGIVTIGELVLATSLNSDLFAAPGNEALLKSMWHESLLCSAWSREIARMRKTNVESSFLGGLLCQIGKPVVVQSLAEFELEADEMLIFIEKYYVRAGALLANSWQLPEVVGQVIIQHSEMDKGADDIVLNVQAALKIALSSIEEGLDSEMQQALNFYEEDIVLLEEKTQVVNTWVETVDV